MKPACQECGKRDKVVKAYYAGKDGVVQWRGWECERCYCVVKEIGGSSFLDFRKRLSKGGSI